MQTLQPYSGKLTKFYRQPKVYLSLPSKGRWYKEGCIQEDVENLPVFGMTAMDEIMFKTPDALFSSESTVSVIKSCIPAITDPWQIPQTDIDTILIGIRIATFGEKMDMTITCGGCSTEYDMAYDLLPLLDYFSQLQFQDVCVVPPLTFKLRPLNYKQQTDMKIDAYRMQKQIVEASRQDDSEQNMKALDSFYKELGKIQASNLKYQIESIAADEDEVSNQQEILDWLNNSEKMFYDGLRKHIDAQRDAWMPPKQKVKCESCGHEQDVTVDLDQSNFFEPS